MKLVLICLAALGVLVTLVLYACVVAAARYDEQSEQWRKQREQERESDQDGEN